MIAAADFRRQTSRRTGFFTVTTVAERGIHPSLVVSGRVVSRLIKSGPVKAGSGSVASRRVISKAGKGHPNTVPFFALPATQ